MNSKFKYCASNASQSETCEAVSSERQIDVESNNSLPNNNGLVATQVNTKELIHQLIGDLVTRTVSVVSSKKVYVSESINRQKARIFPCATCKTMFAQFASAAKHCKQEKLKKTNCPDCNKMIDKKNLSRHRKTHNVSKMLKFYECDECNLTVSSKQKLDNHKLVKHNGNRFVSLTPQNSQFTCTLCDFKHLKMNVVKRHMTVKHSTSKILNCSLCPFICHSRAGLYRHNAQAHKVSAVNSVGVDSCAAEAASDGDICTNESVLGGASSGNKAVLDVENTASKAVHSGESSAKRTALNGGSSLNGAVSGGESSSTGAVSGSQRSFNGVVSESERNINQQESTLALTCGSVGNNQVITLSGIQSVPSFPSVTFPCLANVDTASFSNSRIANVQDTSIEFVSNEAQSQYNKTLCNYYDTSNVGSLSCYPNNSVLLQPVNQNISGSKSNMFIRGSSHSNLVDTSVDLNNLIVAADGRIFMKL